MHFERYSNGGMIDCAQKKEIHLTGQKIFAGNSWRTTGRVFSEARLSAAQEEQLILIVPFEKSVGTRRMAKMAGILLSGSIKNRSL